MRRGVMPCLVGRPTPFPRHYKPGCVYLVLNTATGLIKIGHAGIPEIRATQISAKVGAKCVLVHSIDTNQQMRLERVIQRRFLVHHVGYEWFQLNPDQVAELQRLSRVQYRDVKNGW